MATTETLARRCAAFVVPSQREAVIVGWSGRKARWRQRSRPASGVRTIAVDRLDCLPTCVRWPEVGAVATERADPLLPSVVDGLGDEVGGVAFAATRHGDVRRRRACRYAERDMSPIDGVALGAVHRGRMSELDVTGGVLGGELAISTAAVKCDAAVIADAAHGPGLAVGDLEVGIVAPGGDAIADAQSFAA